MMIDKRIITHFDFLLPLLLLPLIGISYILIGEVSPSQNIRQTIYVLFGLAAFCFVFFLPFRQANKMIIVFYWICIILLILVLVAGTKQLGAQRCQSGYYPAIRATYIYKSSPAKWLWNPSILYFKLLYFASICANFIAT